VSYFSQPTAYLLQWHGLTCVQTVCLLRMLCAECVADHPCVLGLLYRRFLFACVHASVNVHNKLLHHILRLPKTFFDTNPAGRVLNRFSR
jgi:hypothetical protein